MKVLVMEPPNQQLPIDTARPNGALGPAYLVGALRAAGIEADYYDGTVGWPGDPLEETFYNRTEQSNGTIRYGASLERLAEVISPYDVVATSSIFTAQTRMHFEIAAIVDWIARDFGKRILLVSGGVNAVALKPHFHTMGFDLVVGGDGEGAIVGIVRGKPELYQPQSGSLEDLPLPALHALPLETYRDLGIPHAGVLPPGTMFSSIQTSRGCQDRCSFCHISLEKQQGGGYLRKFSTEYIHNYVNYAVDLGITRLYFEDDNLFFSKPRLVELAPHLKRPGLSYSNVNGGNLRFLFTKINGRYEVDLDFIAVLADFGLCELMLPFESRSFNIMEKYATGKYNPDTMDSIALVKALKDAGIRIAGNFMIGFRDESWGSVLRTKDYAKSLMDAGLDACGFMIPVPYPGSLDFQLQMEYPDVRAEFDRDPLYFTDRMHWRGRPLFPTRVPGELLQAAVHEFWEELNPTSYVAAKTERNVR